MRTITVDKNQLLGIVRTNRENHRETFLKAQEIYRTKMVEELERMLEEARKGERIRRAFSLPVPEEHTADYDRLIGMLEMDQATEVELTESEYATYVQDEWGWQHSFASNTSSYVAKN